MLNTSKDIWINKQFINLEKKINFWCDFYVKNNIKINHESFESDTDSIVRLMALNLIGGISITSHRSYIGKNYLTHRYFYNSDIIFCWGNDTSKKIKKDNAYFKYLINTGYPFDNISNNKNNSRIKNFVKKFKMTILIFDSIVTFNSNDPVGISNKDIELFFLNLSNFLRENNDICILFKPKKLNILLRSSLVKKILYENSHKIYVVTESDNLNNLNLSKFCTLSISLSIFFPSTTIESIIKYKRPSIIYDLSNFSKYEKNFNDKQRSVFINNIDDLFIKIIECKKVINRNKNIKFWSDHIPKFNYFNDLRGDIRASDFTYELYDLLQKDYLKDDILRTVTTKFKKKWGNNSIVR